MHTGSDVDSGALVEALHARPALHDPEQAVDRAQGRAVVDQRAAVVVGDDPTAGDNHVARLEHLGGLDLEAVEAVAFEGAELGARLLAGGGEAAVDAFPGGRHRHAQAFGDLPEAGASGAELEGVGVAFGGVDPGRVRPRHRVRLSGVRWSPPRLPAGSHRSLLGGRGRAQAALADDPIHRPGGVGPGPVDLGCDDNYRGSRSAGSPPGGITMGSSTVPEPGAISNPIVVTSIPRVLTATPSGSSISTQRSSRSTGTCRTGR
jgi:hypothetical protein